MEPWLGVALPGGAPPRAAGGRRGLGMQAGGAGRGVACPQSWECGHGLQASRSPPRPWAPGLSPRALGLGDPREAYWSAARATGRLRLLQAGVRIADRTAGSGRPRAAKGSQGPGSRTGNYKLCCSWAAADRRGAFHFPRHLLCTHVLVRQPPAATGCPSRTPYVHGDVQRRPTRRRGLNQHK